MFAVAQVPDAVLGCMHVTSTTVGGVQQGSCSWQPGHWSKPHLVVVCHNMPNHVGYRLRNQHDGDVVSAGEVLEGLLYVAHGCLAVHYKEVGPLPDVHVPYAC
jgi:hypothetical protein